MRLQIKTSDFSLHRRPSTSFKHPDKTKLEKRLRRFHLRKIYWTENIGSFSRVQWWTQDVWRAGASQDRGTPQRALCSPLEGHPTEHFITFCLVEKQPCELYCMLSHGKSFLFYLMEWALFCLICTGKATEEYFGTFYMLERDSEGHLMTFSLKDTQVQDIMDRLMTLLVTQKPLPAHGLVCASTRWLPLGATEDDTAAQ